ncbi:uncharacterized protein LOC125062765 isoform X4 [Pieris napi]|uniref:uncharacterized protein LOC125062765 isoform X4 n=1 Tax=Pieris napi TaxID=78633 RepID=UPI001FBAEE98|nr:uncharacterized protein LOC125062765 isoform X4 [Pieris napi]
MSRNIVFEGWLTKSPPSRRIFKIKWRRRWFALRQSGELPGQYFLDYYSDRNRRRLKGSINLDLCEQVDAGLHMTRNSTGILDPRIRGSVFSIQTQSRTYHLEADCEADMEKWVDAICRVCGLRATSTPPEPVVTIITASEELREIVVPGTGTYQNSTMTVMNDQYEFSEGTGPYIPISECITGVRAADSQSSFTFDPNNIVIGAKSTFEGPEKGLQYLSHPHIRINNVDLSENESNISDEECKSLNASHSNIARYGNIPDTWLLARSYVRPGLDGENRPNLRASGSGIRDRLQVRFSSFNKGEKAKPHSSPRGIGESEEGPPVPPRPPKSFGFIRENRESFQGPKIQEPEGDRSKQESFAIPFQPPFPWLRSSRRMSQEQQVVNRPRVDDNACCLTHQYCNLSSLPPIVDRALKPRIGSTGICHMNHVAAQTLLTMPPETSTRRAKASDTLQYLDLDLTPKSNSKEQDENARAKNAKSFSAESRTDYKTVDFVKTEAFNITRRDAEASRSVQQ